MESYLHREKISISYRRTNTSFSHKIHIPNYVYILPKNPLPSKLDLSSIFSESYQHHTCMSSVLSEVLEATFVAKDVMRNKIPMSHPNRWRKHRGVALSETDCPEVSITTIITRYLKQHDPYHVINDNTIITEKI
ncbi:hypothetical protein HanIR_Chr00c29g0911861 [Helianthus annuus]|nr:hypothetical protein HanIR_Chr00c29g0911861 [Helianthus annuus]